MEGAAEGGRQKTGEENCYCRLEKIANRNWIYHHYQIFQSSRGGEMKIEKSALKNRGESFGFTFRAISGKIKAY